jgi:hypothetical protein
MEDFPANSQKAKARFDEPRMNGSPTDDRPRNVERVTSAEATQRPRGLGRRFRETFISGNARSAGEYMVMEVVIPAIQDTMIDAFQGGVERLIRGESRSRRTMSTSSYSNLPHVNYQGMSSNKPPSTRALSQKSRTRHDFGEIVIPNRQEAEEVLDRLYDILSRYGSVPVADLYELTGIHSSHADHKWGWTSLRGAKIRTMRNGGYLLDLPNPEPLDR